MGRDPYADSRPSLRDLVCVLSSGQLRPHTKDTCPSAGQGSPPGLQQPSPKEPGRTTKRGHLAGAALCHIQFATFEVQSPGGSDDGLRAVFCVFCAVIS